MGATCSTSVGRKDGPKEVIEAPHVVTREEGRRAVFNMLQGGLSRSQLFFVWSHETGGASADTEGLHLVLGHIMRDYATLLKESLRFAIDFYGKALDHLTISDRINKALETDLGPLWEVMMKKFRKMSDEEKSKTVDKQLAQLKLGPAQTITFEKFVTIYSEDMGPAFAQALLLGSDYQPDAFNRIKTKYSLEF